MIAARTPYAPLPMQAAKGVRAQSRLECRFPCLQLTQCRLALHVLREPEAGDGSGGNGGATSWEKFEGMCRRARRAGSVSDQALFHPEGGG